MPEGWPAQARFWLEWWAILVGELAQVAVLTSRMNGCPSLRGLSPLRNSCRPRTRTRFVPLLLSRHCGAGLSHSAATRLIRAFLPPRASAAEFRNTFGFRRLGTTNVDAVSMRHSEVSEFMLHGMPAQPALSLFRRRVIAFHYQQLLVWSEAGVGSLRPSRS